MPQQPDILEGEFRQKPRGGILLWILVPVVLFAYALLNMLDGDAPVRVFFGVAGGLAAAVWGILVKTWNRKPSLRLENGRLTGRYNWRSVVDCPVEDIVYAKTELLSLSLVMADGTCHVINQLENQEDFRKAILLHNVTREWKQPEELILRYKELWAARRRDKRITVWCGVTMVVSIVLGAFLTAGREMQAFSQADWGIFAGSMGLAAVCMVAMLVFADRMGRKKLPLEARLYETGMSFLLHTPLPPGNLILAAVHPRGTGRLMLYGYPNDKSVYYCIQRLVPNKENILKVENYYRSRVFSSREELPEDLLEPLWVFRQEEV